MMELGGNEKWRAVPAGNAIPGTLPGFYKKKSQLTFERAVFQRFRSPCCPNSQAAQINYSQTSSEWQGQDHLDRSKVAIQHCCISNTKYSSTIYPTMCIFTAFNITMYWTCSYIMDFTDSKDMLLMNTALNQNLGLYFEFSSKNRDISCIRCLKDFSDSLLVKLWK